MTSHYNNHKLSYPSNLNQTSNNISGSNPLDPNCSAIKIGLDINEELKDKEKAMLLMQNLLIPAFEQIAADIIVNTVFDMLKTLYPQCKPAGKYPRKVIERGLNNIKVKVKTALQSALTKKKRKFSSSESLALSQTGQSTLEDDIDTISGDKEQKSSLNITNSSKKSKKISK